MALPNRFQRFQGPRPVDMTGPYMGVNSIPQHVSGFREGFNKTPKNVLESLFNLPDRPSHQDVQGVLQSRNQQADAGHASGVSAANDALKLWGVAAPMIGQYESGVQTGQAAQRQPYPAVPQPVPQQQRPTQSVSLPTGGLQSLVNQVQDVATTPVGGGPRLPMAQPQPFAAPQQFANSRSPSMTLPIGSQSVMPASNYDPAVWGPGGRQYPTAMPAAPSGGLQSPVVAPRYGQSAQQAAMSLQNSRQQARDFTNQGVDRIFATNGGPVTTSVSFTGPPNPQSPIAQSMPYGSGSTLIRTADGRTILAGRSPDSRAESSIASAMSQNGGTIPQGVFNSIQQASAANSAARNAQNPMMTQRRANMKASDAAARDRQIVTNAMRFGVRNPLAIETAQRMGIRLPGMPRMSGDAMAVNSQPTTQQMMSGLAAADNDQSYGFVQQGFKPSAAQGADWSSFIQNPSLAKLNPQNIRAMQGHLKLAMATPNFRADSVSQEFLDAFMSGGPKAVEELKKKRSVEAEKILQNSPQAQPGLRPGRLQ